MRFKIVDESTTFAFYALYTKRWLGPWKYAGYRVTLEKAEELMMTFVKPHEHVNYYNSDGSREIEDLS